MARVIGRLNAAHLKTLGPGLHADGGGLYLSVSAAGARSWIYRFMLHGRAREMGLGPLHTIGLAEARRRAVECRLQRLDGVDPIEARRSVRQQAKRDDAPTMTFRHCAAAYIAAHRAGWRNAKHAAQWDATLAAYVYPVFGPLPVAAIDVGLVMQALEPIWTGKPETASRVRGRIEAILDYAAARGWRAGENPARWRGHLDKLLPALDKAKRAARQLQGRDAHHAALPYDEIGALMAELRAQPGTAARAVEFAILTAARTGEVFGATWSEIDLGNRVWTIPATRMKAGREHRVPLSEAAIAVLRPLASLSQGYVFPSRAGRPLSGHAGLTLLRRLQRPELTVHGFRSTFRDWAAERTSFPAEVAEMALAHTIGDKVEAAYRRGDLFAKRRKLMEAWAAFCARPAAGDGAVVALRA